jgi:hypothetical protein
MSSGLIWSALGKSVSNAGNMYGQYVMDEAKSRASEERMIQREDRAEARRESAAKRDADIYAAAEAAAPGVGDDRRFAKFKKDLGETDMPEADLRNVFDSQYNQKRTGDFEDGTRYLERYSKEREDVLNQIRSMGGSSGLVTQARDSVKTASAAESAADRLAFDERKAERKEAVDQKRLENQDRALDIRDKQVVGMINRVNSGGSGRERKGDSYEEQLTKAENDLIAARKNFNFREPSASEKYGPGKATYESERQAAMASDPIIKRRQALLDSLATGGASERAPVARPPTSGTRAPLSTFIQR